MSIINLSNFKTFKNFLLEANFGALQKDDRIHYLSDIFIDDMVSVISISDKTSFKSRFVERVSSKYKEIKNIECKIEWQIVTSEVTSLTSDICRSGRVEILKNNTFNFIFEFEKLKTDSDVLYRKKLVKYIKSNIMLVTLLHEIKHMLDFIDGIYPEKYYPPKNTSHKEISRYVSQKAEIHNYLISVLSDIKRIKDENPNLTYRETIKKSSAYYKVLSYLNDKEIKKFKSKILCFWYENYEINEDKL